MTTLKVDDKVTVRVPCRLPSSKQWDTMFGDYLTGEGREITPGIQLWLEVVGVERATVREADGSRFEVEMSNLVAW